jgi:hypothetical protein
VLADATLTNPRRLGKRLHALQGRVLHGMTLARVGVDRAGALWIVSVARDSRPSLDAYVSDGPSAASQDAGDTSKPLTRPPNALRKRS